MVFYEKLTAGLFSEATEGNFLKLQKNKWVLVRKDNEKKELKSSATTERKKKKVVFFP